jgi:hypothetical protein
VDAGADVGVLHVLCCTACGFEVHAEASVIHAEVFEWTFDAGHRVIWNVSAMRDDLLRCNAPTIVVPHAACRTLISMNPTAVEDGRKLTREEALHTPIIIIAHPSDAAGVFPLLPVDGWHRMQWAAENEQDISAWCITREGEMRYRISDEQL